MKLIFIIPISIIIFFSCQKKEDEKVATIKIKKIIDYPVSSSVRALEVVDENNIWFAGSGGVYGFTDDGGETWNIDSLKFNNKAPSFRSIAVTNKAVFLLSIASPALLYKSVDKGRNWVITYQENDTLAFYDAMTFWNEKEGLAMGDPIGGCLSVIITRDGGDSWNKIPCDKLPNVYEGEAAFAASNSNLAVYGDHVWMVTGGKKSRVFHSKDRGRTWEVFETPITQGEVMTGIYSVDFYDDKNGIIYGGNWEKQDLNTNNKAITNDGGKTWELVANGAHPGYRSQVRYFPNQKAEKIIAVGSPGISFSMNQGKEWQLLSSEGFYAARFVPNTNILWLSGRNRISKIVWE